ALYKGWTVFSTGMILNRIIQFGTYENLQNQLKMIAQSNQLAVPSTTFSHLFDAVLAQVISSVAGAASGVAASMVIVPNDVISQRVQIRLKKVEGPVLTSGFVRST